MMNSPGSLFTVGVNSGAVSGADYFNGQICDVAIWRGVLTVDQIQSLASGRQVTTEVIGPELMVKHAVSWPVAGAEGFILEVADDPAGPWVQVQTTPATNGEKNVVVIDSGAVKKFYRLRKP